MRHFQGECNPSSAGQPHWHFEEIWNAANCVRPCEIGQDANARRHRHTKLHRFLAPISTELNVAEPHSGLRLRGRLCPQVRPFLAPVTLRHRFHSGIIHTAQAAEQNSPACDSPSRSQPQHSVMPWIMPLSAKRISFPRADRGRFVRESLPGFRSGGIRQGPDVRQSRSSRTSGLFRDAENWP